MTKLRKEVGRRYLAGLVVAGAIVHLGAVAVSTLQHPGRPQAIEAFLIVGAAPAAIAIYLGQRAWNARDDGSAGYAAAGLVALLVGAILARFLVPR